MKHLNLRQSLLFMALLPSTGLAMLLVAYFTISDMRLLESQLHSSGLATVRHLAPISEYSIIAGQNESLYGLVQATLQQPWVKSAIVVSKKGRAIAVSGHVSLASETLQQAPTTPRQVAETENWVAYGAPVIRSGNEIEPIFENIAAEHTEHDEVIAYVFVELDKTSLRDAQHTMLQRSVALIIIGLLFIYVLTITMANHLVSPILRLVKAVRGMSTGDFGCRVPHDTPGEIGELEAGFNEMAQHLQEIHQSMQERIEEATAQLAFQARHDPLTSLLNRREFESRLEKTLESVRTGGDEGYILFIDVDRFKPVNDNCGHLAGDELLRQLAQLLQGRLREGDTLARLGGDEFGVLLHQCNKQAALQVANDLCSLTAAYRFIWQDKVFAISASIGMSSINPQAHDIKDILGTADAACYRAKEAGRNQVVEQEAASSSERRQANSGWQERILRALTEERLLIDAHPICPLHTETPSIHRVELAARLNEPGQTPISLTTLIEAAERFDLAPQIDQRLLDKAISTLARSQNTGKILHCFVPISATSLCQPETITFISNALRHANISGAGLCLVLSEDIASRYIGNASHLAQQIKTLGGNIALEDFGASTASFGLLRSLAPQYVKFGHSLTRELNGNRASTALLRAMVEITVDLGIQTMAVHVDDPRQFSILANLQIDCAKGYAVGPTEPFDAWLEGTVMRGVI